MTDTKKILEISQALNTLANGFYLTHQYKLAWEMLNHAIKLTEIFKSLRDEELARASEAVKVAEQAGRNMLEAALAGAKAKGTGDEP
jgi:hypothetical protein